ncbi:MAG TPA: rod shape-determining protein MreC [Pirellulales bacterium]|jgi:hypothetical protein|nr:rod shape-determining protein MreC [Pirellulales bacterium]
MFRRDSLRRTPGRRIAAWLLTALAAFALASLPDAVVARLRDWQRQCLLPAQKRLLSACSARPQQEPGDVESLEQYRAEFETAAAAALARLDAQQAAGGSQGERLLVPTALVAQVIGRQGRSFFEQTLELDVGLAEAVLPHAWVLDRSLPLVDHGRSSGIEPGHLVLAGRRVWGQVRDVGQHTSTVQRVTAAGYRDLVQLAGQSEEASRLGPRGILEGIGEPHCRVRMVKSIEPIEVGDLVLSAGGDELLPTPLIYGRIVRAERARGAVHWELWMEPAARESPAQLTVVRLSLNAARLAHSAAADPAGRPLAGEAARR